MKRSKAKRGGTRGAGADIGENAKPVRSGNKNFTKTAKKVHPSNNYAPMRGGIRF